VKRRMPMPQVGSELTLIFYKRIRADESKRRPRKMEVLRAYKGAYIYELQTGSFSGASEGVPWRCRVLPYFQPAERRLVHVESLGPDFDMKDLDVKTGRFRFVNGYMMCNKQSPEKLVYVIDRDVPQELYPVGHEEAKFVVKRRLSGAWSHASSVLIIKGLIRSQSLPEGYKYVKQNDGVWRAQRV